MSINEPIVEKIDDNINSLNIYENDLSTSNNKLKKNIIMNFPIVYIHDWKKQNEYEVYVGEANNIFQRTKQHYDKMIDINNWQHNLDCDNAELYIIGHEHFNKSMTLDIENRVIHYLTGVESIKMVHNKRGNPQNRYYPSEELDIIFNKIWAKLMRDNNKLFPSESIIKHSAIYKSSPLHKLTLEQQRAKDVIIQKIENALKNDERGQLIFVEGEAGTGKTVLNSSVFYEMFCRYENSQSDEEEEINFGTSNCVLLVNHDELLNVYNQIFEKLGLIEKYGQIVYKPTSFINKKLENDLVDVAFIDEAHLLLTQGKQSYRGNNQLEDILNKSKVVVVMFDENQILTTEQYWEYEKLNEYKQKALKKDNYITLHNQLRIQANENVISWIDSFTKDGIVRYLPEDLENYDIKIFDNPKDLEKAIKEKANDPRTRLSRLIATYDWPYKQNKSNENGLWEVKIGEWHKPWNRELEKTLSRHEINNIKKFSWAEQPQTIDEVGSTFTIQGFDLNYAGVIIGPSVKFSNGHIIFDPKESCNEKATRKRTLSDGRKMKFAEDLLKHELRILLTRGVNGLYIYACNKELREYLKICANTSFKYSIGEENMMYNLKVAEDSEKYNV